MIVGKEKRRKMLKIVLKCGRLYLSWVIKSGAGSGGQMFLMAATNRIEAIDPALRRAGRFDREIYIPLPTKEVRHCRNLSINETTGKFADHIELIFKL